jgi:hypothetical protein
VCDSPVPQETEATLIILSESPDCISRTLATRPSLGGHELEQQKVQAIRDRYFDTPDGALGARGYALRLRESGTGQLIALKGSGRTTGQFSTVRLEIEGSWSQGALEAIVNELQKQGGLSIQLPIDLNGGQPDEVLRSIGFCTLQDRETERQLFVVHERGTGNRIAEIAVDSVTYHLSSGEAVHRELEVEAINEQGVAELDRMIQALLERFPGALRPWQHSKLATGLALERQLAGRERPAQLRPDGSLLPAAYDHIERTLNQ